MIVGIMMGKLEPSGATEQDLQSPGVAREEAEQGEQHDELRARCEREEAGDIPAK